MYHFRRAQKTFLKGTLLFVLPKCIALANNLKSCKLSIWLKNYFSKICKHKFMNLGRVSKAIHHVKLSSYVFELCSPKCLAVILEWRD